MSAHRFRRVVRRGLLLAVAHLVSPYPLHAAGTTSLVPLPAVMEPGVGTFSLSSKTVVRIAEPSTDLTHIAGFLRERLKYEYSLALEETASATAIDNEIRLAFMPPQNELGREGYELTITPERILIQASTPTGAFWGVQTLLQMAALESKPSTGEPRTVSLPATRVVDRPAFAWRGLMLDCSRTFLPIDYLEKYVDTCSFYKMNVLHLHLTDDQGWRLEIRKHPRLTERGSQFAPVFAGEVGGYYTREQIQDLVRHAAERCITIVPEIEMPGHCLALLAAYPDLSCRQGKDAYVIAPYLFQSDRDPDKSPKTPHGVLCPGNERTFAVIGDILDEVVDLFPGDYIHIGGDECSKSFWKQCAQCQARMKAEGLDDEEQLQSYFIKRIAAMIQARGRTAIGWDEILEGGLAPATTVMGWRGMEYTATAAGMGHPVIMAQKSHLYFDYCYNRTPARLVYAFDPAPSDWPSDQRSLVRGLQACMWTHLARSQQMIDMSIFPRLLALAEVGWTPADRRQWQDFSTRMARHEPILRAKGIHCFERNDGLPPPNLSAGQDGRLWLVNDSGEIHLRKGDAWERFPGRARQVTSGSDGTIWAIGTEPAARGYVVKSWSEGDWKPVGPGVAAVQLSAAPDGSLWTVTEAYAIWHYADERWANVLGLAREVSAAPDGKVWILTADPAAGGFELFSAPQGGRWRRVQPPMGGLRIAAGPADRLWLIRDDGAAFCLTDGQWQERPGRLSQLAVTTEGEAWALTKPDASAAMAVVKWTGNGWHNLGPLP